MPVNGAGVLPVLLSMLMVTGQPVQRPLEDRGPSAETYHGFTFEKGDCERHPVYCARRQPKTWTSEEISLVNEAIDEILRRPLGQDALAACRQRGFVTLRRYTALGSLESRLLPRYMPAPVANLHRDPLAPSIDFNDEFFRDRGLRDDFSGRPGYLVVAATLLHECMHAVDDVSERTDFRDLVGFVRAGTRWRFAARTPEDVSMLTAFDKELVRVARLSDHGGVRRMNRYFALRMSPIRVPTMSAVKSPEEAFAEIGAHLILDDRAREYLPKEIAAYFDQHVFPELRRR